MSFLDAMMRGQQFVQNAQQMQMKSREADLANRLSEQKLAAGEFQLGMAEDEYAQLRREREKAGILSDIRGDFFKRFVDQATGDIDPAKFTEMREELIRLGGEHPDLIPEVVQMMGQAGGLTKDILADEKTSVGRNLLQRWLPWWNYYVKPTGDDPQGRAELQSEKKKFNRLSSVLQSLAMPTNISSLLNAEEE